MLTDDMTRLCNEIVGMRRARGSFMQEMRRDTKARAQAVGELCEHFGTARQAMARRTKSERVAFLNGLRRSVGAHRREMRTDLEGARRAWAGKSA